MSYRTILLHAGSKLTFAGIMRPALALARRFDAHVTALAVLPPPVIQPVGAGGALETSVVDEHREIFRAECSAMKAIFETAAREAGLDDRHEWICDEAVPWPAWHTVADYARVSDIAVVSQGSDEPGVLAFSGGPEEIVLGAGRPVLVVPRTGDHTGIGRRIVIAWNGRREAARAAFDALPLLIGAQSVRILWVNPGDEPDVAEDVPAADLATALARHKVRCEAAEITRDRADVGSALMMAARDWEADLLVMGCYGHSRLREVILGGATRDLLRRMTLPVLMSH